MNGDKHDLYAASTSTPATDVDDALVLRQHDLVQCPPLAEMLDTWRSSADTLAHRWALCFWQ
jgi:hypothetical protein